MRIYPKITLLTLLLCTPQILQGQNLLVNGDFEADTFTVWPGYLNGENADTGAINPEAISGWTGGSGINPVFTEGGQNPLEVTGWTRGVPGNLGINPITDGAAPFGDNGDNDGGFLFLQGSVSAYQDVSGLTVGSDYVLSVDYNSRNCCGDIPSASLEIGGEMSDAFPDPEDFFDSTVDPVLEGAWWFTEIPFEATAESMRIEFFAESSAGGDATFLLDNIEVTAASGGDSLIENGDFEADLDAFGVFPGYLGTDGGEAPFRDNGNNKSQIALLQGAASIEQLVEGLTPGEEYTISLDFNARNCCGDVPAPLLLIDDELMLDFPFEDDLIVVPVEGENDWYTYETTFTAEFDSALLRIETASDGGGDSTLIIDNVFFGTPGAEVVPGDCNLDGVVNATDLACVGDAGERDIVLNAIPTLAGDLDGDGDVAFADFLILSANFGQDLPSYTDGNVDLEGGIGFPDFLVLSANFGQAAVATVVPEPNGLIFLAVGVVCMSRLRRRR